jgi:hypothetical protein
MREGGMLHLSQGQVVYAESPATPGLDALLVAHGALDEEAWREVLAQAGPRHLVGRFLVDSGRIGQGALELCHLAALYDAAYFVLGPSSAPARFRYGEDHWLGPLHPVPVAAVERETLRRRDLLHGIWPDPAIDEAPLVRTDRPTAPEVTPRQEAVLNRMDGTRTAADISRALGRPAFHTLVDVHRLAAAGLVAPRTGPPQTGPPRAGRAQAFRTAEPVGAAEPAPGDQPPAATGRSPSQPDPYVTLLKRLRDALEAL